MEVAETLTKEKLLYSSNNFTSYAQNTSDYVSTNGSSRDTNASEVDIEAMKETSLLLDAAVTLCSIAAKKVIRINYCYQITFHYKVYVLLLIRLIKFLKKITI